MLRAADQYTISSLADENPVQSDVERWRPIPDAIYAAPRDAPIADRRRPRGHSSWWEKPQSSRFSCRGPSSASWVENSGEGRAAGVAKLGPTLDAYNSNRQPTWLQARSIWNASNCT